MFRLTFFSTGAAISNSSEDSVGSFDLEAPFDEIDLR